MQFGIRLNELSVKIVTWKRCSVVTNDNAIRINHWNNFKHCFSSEIDRFGWGPSDKIQKSVHNIAWVRFTRVDSSTNNNVLFEFVNWSLLISLKVILVYFNCTLTFTSIHVTRNSQNWNTYARKTVAEMFFLHILGYSIQSKERLKVGLQVAIGVRQTVRKVNGVVSLFKIICKLHLI